MEVEDRFGERVKLVRAARHWSAAELAERSGMERRAISKIENRTRGVGLDEAVALSDALGVPLVDMIRVGRFAARATIVFEVDK